MQNLPHFVATRLASDVPSPAYVCRNRTFAPPVVVVTCVQGVVIVPCPGMNSLYRNIQDALTPASENFAVSWTGVPSSPGLGFVVRSNTVGATFWMNRFPEAEATSGRISVSCHLKSVIMMT